MSVHPEQNRRGPDDPSDLAAQLQRSPQVMLVGRGLEPEYRLMFDLDLSTLAKDTKILDVASGVASFNADMRARGFNNITSVDPIYALPLEQILKAADTFLADFQTKFSNPEVSYQSKDGADPAWLVNSPISEIDTPSKLLAVRRNSLESFSADFRARGDEAYVRSQLPNLNGVRGQYDLILCGNFLMAYTRENVEMTVASIERMAELLSPKGQIRIYPGGEAFREVEETIRQRLFEKNIFLESKKSQHSFVKGWDCMYEITKI